MSLARLDSVHASLPPRNRGIEHVRRLRTGAGKRINPAEARRFEQILRREWNTFDRAGRRALEVLVGRAAPDIQPIRFGKATVRSTGVAEQSGLAHLGSKYGFVTIGDDSSVIHRIVFSRKGAKVHVLTSGPRDLRGLEGCAYDAVRRSLLLVSEDSRRVWRFDVNLAGDVPRLGKHRKIGKLPVVGRRGNKGWEGLAVLDASRSPDEKAHILAVHEGFPRAIGVFNPRTLALEGFPQFPPHLGGLPLDLSDIAVHQSGRVFVLSDESNAVFQMELRYGPGVVDGTRAARQWGLVFVGEPTSLPGRGCHPQAEGLCFDHRGDLWVACEAGSRVFHLPRLR